jgi:hypothetical protein
VCPQMCSVLQVLLHRKFSVLRLVVAVPNVRCAGISTAPQIKWRFGPEQEKGNKLDPRSHVHELLVQSRILHVAAGSHGPNAYGTLTKESPHG